MPPEEFTRREVAGVLIEAYRSWRSVTWELSLTGLLIGLLVGATGMGGGALMTPLLIFLFGFKPTLAVGTDILHGAVFKTFGAVRHRRLGTVHAHLTLWMFMTSAPFSLVGVQVAEWIEDRYGDSVRSVSAKVIGALVLGGLGFLAKTYLKRGVQPNDAPLLLQRRDRVIALCLGAGGGFIVGLTSVGSGTFFALVMLLVFPLTAVKIVGTDIFHAAALLWVAGQPPAPRQRRPRRHVVAAAGVDSRRADRESDHGTAAGPRTAHRARDGVADEWRQAARAAGDGNAPRPRLAPRYRVARSQCRSPTSPGGPGRPVAYGRAAR